MHVSCVRASVALQAAPSIVRPSPGAVALANWPVLLCDCILAFIMGRVPTTKTVLTVVRRFERYLNSLRMMPATRFYRNAVILPLLSKALTVSRAICVLIDSGFHAEAFATSRTLIEIYFSLRYICNKDTEKRAARYINYGARIRLEWQAIVMKHFPNTPPERIKLSDAVLEKAKEFRSKAHWTGSGGQARVMALEPDEFETDEHGNPADSAFDYEALYFWTSQYVHATVGGIEAQAIGPEQVFKVRARPSEDKPRGKEALFNSVLYLCKIFVTACRSMNEEQPEVLHDANKLISRFAGKKL